MIEIEVDKYYSNRCYYPYMSVSVFDALEAAFLAGANTASVPLADYSAMLSQYTANYGNI